MNKKWLIGGGVLGLLIVAGGIWFVFFKDDAPEAVSNDAANTQLDSSGAQLAALMNQSRALERRLQGNGDNPLTLSDASSQAKQAQSLTADSALSTRNRTWCQLCVGRQHSAK